MNKRINKRNSGMGKQTNELMKCFLGFFQVQVDAVPAHETPDTDPYPIPPSRRKKKEMEYAPPTRYSPRRSAPPPPPKVSVSLLSDMDLPIAVENIDKHSEGKDEKKGLFGNIFKRKK